MKNRSLREFGKQKCIYLLGAPSLFSDCQPSHPTVYIFFWVRRRPTTGKPSMRHQGIGCVVKWFYLVLIVHTLLCIGQIECRQSHNRNSNNSNNNNRRSDSSSSEEGQGNASEGLDNYADQDTVGHNHQPRRGQRKKHQGGGGGGGGGGSGAGNGGGGGNRHNRNDESGISLWINEQQLKMLTALYFPQGYSERLYAIHNSRVTNDLRDTTLYNFLVIPSEVNYVNFTWKSGRRKYFYDFDRLQTMDESILKAPTLSIRKSGRIPQEQKNFSIFLPCTGNSSGTASFNVGLKIQTRHNKPLSGTPIRLNFKKECAHRGICKDKCLNGGKCIQKDKCQCSKGYYGLRCEYSKCVIPCKNEGRCIGNNLCRCPNGLRGDHCEIGRKQRSICKCRNGTCTSHKHCKCHPGFYGRHCNGRKRRHAHRSDASKL
ncbi:protein shifted isoform X6 [Drosophila biarmipes]|uniref:protein shifted isoform X6 n=1 Tax=Drosophila biarmipes TaxID=125945 RepID=UPI0021CC6E38|nr:protein shifted isoform X6 [Drosophila biarmipes]